MSRRMPSARCRSSIVSSKGMIGSGTCATSLAGRAQAAEPDHRQHVAGVMGHAHDQGPQRLARRSAPTCGPAGGTGRAFRGWPGLSRSGVSRRTASRGGSRQQERLLAVLAQAAEVDAQAQLRGQLLHRAAQPARLLADVQLGGMETEHGDAVEPLLDQAVGQRSCARFPAACRRSTARPRRVPRRAIGRATSGSAVARRMRRFQPHADGQQPLAIRLAGMAAGHGAIDLGPTAAGSSARPRRRPFPRCGSGRKGSSGFPGRGRFPGAAARRRRGAARASAA